MISSLQDESLHQFLIKLNDINPSAAILRVTQPFAAKFAANRMLDENDKNLPKPLSDLYDTKYDCYSLEELRVIPISFSVTKEEQLPCLEFPI